MDKKQAIQIIENVYSKFVGTIQEHQVVQEAIKVLSTEEVKQLKKK